MWVLRACCCSSVAALRPKALAPFCCLADPANSSGPRSGQLVIPEDNTTGGSSTDPVAAYMHACIMQPCPSAEDSAHTERLTQSEQAGE